MKLKDKLYPVFKEWCYNGTIWVIGDTHFDDSDCTLINSNWPTSDQQVKLINSKVGKKDTLIILGDVGNVDYIRKLKGYKVLIMGNHDKGASNYKRIETYEDIIGTETINELKEKFPFFKGRVKYDTPVAVSCAYCDNGLFDEVYEGPLFIGPEILLSHEPIPLRFGLNVHGHVHDGFKSLCDDSNYAKYNVCSNIIGWIPQRLDEIILSNKVTDIHRITIDKVTARKQ